MTRITDPERFDFYADLRHVAFLARKAIVELESSDHITATFRGALSSLARQNARLTDRTREILFRATNIPGPT